MDAEFAEMHSDASSEMRQFLYHALWLAAAVRDWRYLILSITAACLLLGILYCATAPRRCSTKASLLITQAGGEQMNTSLANESRSTLDCMSTFENILRSAKVLEVVVSKLPAKDCIDFGDASAESRMGILQSKMTTKVIRNTNVLEVNYVSQDPQVAADVLSAIVQSYLDFIDTVHKGTAEEINKILTRERNLVAADLERKQGELLAVRRSLADIGFRSEGQTLHPLVQRAVFFNDALISAQKQCIECEAALASLHSVLEKGGDVTQCIHTISDIFGKELIMDRLGLGAQSTATRVSIEQELLKARTDLQLLEQNLGARHPEVIALHEKIAMLEEFLSASSLSNSDPKPTKQHEQLGSWLTQMLQTKLEEAREIEAIYKTRFEAAREKAVNLNGQLVQVELLERDVKRLADMSDVLLNQIASLNLKQNGPDIRVTVIEEPKVVSTPISPKLSVAVAGSLALGLCLSLVTVLVLEALNDRFRSVDELQERLKVAVLGVIRHVDLPAAKGAKSLLMHATPNAPECEGYRTLRTALGMTHEKARLMLISSAESSDGKTTTVANLAVCYAQFGKQVLLIDGDLHRTGLTQLFEMRGVRGLSEVLRGEEEISVVAPKNIRRSVIKGLDVLAAGPRSLNPSELLAGPRLSQLLSWAMGVYDYVFIDSTPALITSDPAIIAHVIDGVLILVRPSKNRRRLISHIIERFDLLKIPVLGLVVNADGLDKEVGYQYGDYNDYGSYEAADVAEKEFDGRRAEKSIAAANTFPCGEK